MGTAGMLGRLMASSQSPLSSISRGSSAHCTKNRNPRGEPRFTETWSRLCSLLNLSPSPYKMSTCWHMPARMLLLGNEVVFDCAKIYTNNLNFVWSLKFLTYEYGFHQHYSVFSFILFEIEIITLVHMLVASFPSFFFFRYGLMYPRLILNLLYRQRWSGTFDPFPLPPEYWNYRCVPPRTIMQGSNTRLYRH